MSEEAKNISKFSALIIAIITVAYMFGIITNDVSRLKEDTKVLQSQTLSSEQIRELIKDEEDNLLFKLDLRYYKQPVLDEAKTDINILKLRLERLKKEIDDLETKIDRHINQTKR